MAAATQVKALETQLLDLKILNGGKDFLIDQLRKEREGLFKQVVDDPQFRLAADKDCVVQATRPALRLQSHQTTLLAGYAQSNQPPPAPTVGVTVRDPSPFAAVEQFVGFGLRRLSPLFAAAT